MAPTNPMTIPSTINGALTKPFLAPISFIIAISSLRTAIPTDTVFPIRNHATRKRTIIIVSEIMLTRPLTSVSELAVTSERLTERTPSIFSILAATVVKVSAVLRYTVYEAESARGLSSSKPSARSILSPKYFTLYFSHASSGDVYSISPSVVWFFR